MVTSSLHGHYGYPGPKALTSKYHVEAQPHFVWYDYFCCPQSSCTHPSEDGTRDSRQASPGPLLSKILHVRYATIPHSMALRMRKGTPDISTHWKWKLCISWVGRRPIPGLCYRSANAPTEHAYVKNCQTKIPQLHRPTLSPVASVAEVDLLLRSGALTLRNGGRWEGDHVLCWLPTARLTVAYSS